MKELVKELDTWLKREQTDRELRMLLCKYINAHGDKTMVSLLSSQSSKYKTAAVLHDRLGWSNFMEGCISSMWVEHVKDNIRRLKLSKSGRKWARGLMTRLMQITHQQWSYRNATRTGAPPRNITKCLRKSINAWTQTPASFSRSTNISYSPTLKHSLGVQ